MIFNVVLKDKNETEAIGNYMRNRDVPASSIQPLSLSTEERLIMELGYNFTDVIAEWGGFFKWTLRIRSRLFGTQLR